MYTFSQYDGVLLFYTFPPINGQNMLSFKILPSQLFENGLKVLPEWFGIILLVLILLQLFITYLSVMKYWPTGIVWYRLSFQTLNIVFGCFGTTMSRALDSVEAPT